MRFDRTRDHAVLACAMLLAACGGFGRGKPSPAGPCDPAQSPGFDPQVRAILSDSCGSCHGAGGVAGGTDLLLGGSVADDYAAVVALVEVAQPDRSELLGKASGNAHGGGVALAATSADYQTVLAWIGAGAQLSGGCDLDAGSNDAMVPDATVGDDAGATPDADVAQDADVDASSQPTDASVDAGMPRDGGVPVDAGQPPSYAQDIHPLLIDHCQDCHSETGVASTSDLVFVDDAVTDYATVLEFVDVDDPEASVLLEEVSGNDHGGGEQFSADSSEYAQLLEWIDAGAAP